MEVDLAPEMMEVPLKPSNARTQRCAQTAVRGVMADGEASEVVRRSAIAWLTRSVHGARILALKSDAS